MKTRNKLAGLLGAIVLLGTGAAVALADSPEPTLEDVIEASHADIQGPGQVAEHIHSGPSTKLGIAERASVATGFSVFDSGKSLDLRFSPLFPSELVDQFELDMSMSVAGSEGASNGVALTPGPDSICVSNQRMATCGSLEAGYSGKILGVTLCGPGLRRGSVEVVGVLPNGAEDLSIQVSDADEPVLVDVPQNGYAVAIQGRPVSISWTMPDRFGSDGDTAVDAKRRAQTVALPVPEDYSFDNCDPTAS